jgi:hypothetical protein
MPNRRNFGEVFEGKKAGGHPLLHMRRFNAEDVVNHPMFITGSPVGLFSGARLVAVVEFEDLFDDNGNRFYND